LLQRAPSSVGGAFVPFLDVDNHDLALGAQQVLETINGDLGQLLRLPSAEFWRVVAGDPSLRTCLDSFLRFRRCQWVVFSHVCRCCGLAATIKGAAAVGAASCTAVCQHGCC
jgi:hypothetical protein